MKTMWQTKKLCEIGNIFNGNSINEKIKQERYLGLPEGMPYIGTKDVGFDTVINYENGVKIPKKEIPTFKIARPNSVLICAEGGSAGRKIGFTDRNVCFGNKLFAFEANDEVESRYVFYYYFSSFFQKQFSSVMSGIIGGVSMNKFKEIVIKLPDRNTQIKTVERLNDIFESVENAKLLAAKNLKYSNDLFDLSMHSYFSDSANGESKSLSEICEISSMLVDPKLKDYQEMLHIGGANIQSKTGEIFDLKTAKDEGLISGKFVFDENMVLYSKIRPYLMKVARPDFVGLCSADIYPLRPKDKLLDRNYLYYLLLSPKFTEYAITGSARAGMPKVNRNHLFAFTTKIPSLKAQIQIVKKLDLISEEVTKLKNNYIKKIENLNELKTASIERAFLGEL